MTKLLSHCGSASAEAVGVGGQKTHWEPEKISISFWCWEPLSSPRSELPTWGIQAGFPLPSMAMILGISGQVPALFEALSVMEFLDNPCPE